MVQVDLPLAFAAGAGLALAARRRLRDEPSLRHNRALSETMAYLGSAFVPATLAFLALWPEWDVMYAWSRAEIPAFLVPLFASGLFAAGVAGFVSTHALVRRGRSAIALALAIACLVYVMGVIVLHSDRVFYVGTQAGYRAGPSVNLFRSSLFWGQIALLGGPIGTPLALLARRFSRA